MSDARGLPCVAVYRDRLLPSAQRFIAAQIGGLKRHRAVFVGTRIVEPRLLPPNARILAPGSRSGAFLMKARLGVPRDVLEALREEAPRLVHGQFGTDGVWALPLTRKLGLPLVVTFRGFDIARRETSSLPYWIYARLRRRLYAECHTIIAVCRYLAEKLAADGCPAEKIQVVYNGIDPAEFRPDPAVPRGEEVLFVGRLVEKKGVETLLRAMRIVQRERPGARLVLIGDGPKRAALESVARADGIAVELLGRQPIATVRSWMNRARVFCLPSRTGRDGDAEGLPNVVLESQAMGLPLVSTRHAGIPEAVADGATGLLVAEGDAPALADRILLLMHDQALWQRLAIEARRNIERNFDAVRHVERLELLYERAERDNARAA